MPCPVVITVFQDKSFEFIIKKPPASFYIKKEINIKKGSGTTGISDAVGKISMQQLKKLQRKNYLTLIPIILTRLLKLYAGTAKSMGVEVTD